MKNKYTDLDELNIFTDKSINFTESVRVEWSFYVNIDSECIAHTQQRWSTKYVFKKIIYCMFLSSVLNKIWQL